MAPVSNRRATAPLMTIGGGTIDSLAAAG